MCDYTFLFKVGLTSFYFPVFTLIGYPPDANYYLFNAIPEFSKS